MRRQVEGRPRRTVQFMGHSAESFDWSWLLAVRVDDVSIDVSMQGKVFEHARNHLFSGQVLHAGTRRRYLNAQGLLIKLRTSLGEGCSAIPRFSSSESRLVKAIKRSNSVSRFDAPALYRNLLLFSLEFPFRRREAVRRRKIPSWRGKATVRPRRQGRRGMAFIGAKRKPLHGRSGRIRRWV